jgi:hypothetical protein
MGTGGPFPKGKARPGCDVNHSPPSSDEVKKEQELYLLSTHAPPWRVAGSIYLYGTRNEISIASIYLWISKPVKYEKSQRTHLKEKL